jgi:hypothetical protein
VLHCQLLGATSRHRAISGAISRHHTAIRHNIQVLHHQPLGKTSRHCSAIRHNIKMLCCQQLGATSRHCPTIKLNIKSSCCQPSGPTSKHCAASHHPQTQSIVPPLGTYPKYHATIGCFFHALRCCAHISCITAPLACAASSSQGTRKSRILRRCIAVAGILP